jgi:hypothetical protein
MSESIASKNKNEIVLAAESKAVDFDLKSQMVDGSPACDSARAVKNAYQLYRL